MPTPLRVSRPNDSCSFDVDADQARTSHQNILQVAAHTGAAVFPAHFAGRGAITVTPANRAFQIREWTPLAAI